MKKYLFLFWGAVLLVSTAFAGTVRLQPLEGKITLDGKLDEKIWQRKADVEKFYLFGAVPDGFKPVGTKAFFYIDQRFIYAGIRCEEPFMQKLKLTGKKLDDAVWKDDGIELFFIPAPAKSSYVQIVFNANGIVFDLFQKEPGVTQSDLSWNSNAICKTYKGKNFWSLEAAIPLENLPVEAPTGDWKFHMARNRAWKGEQYSFVKGIGSFHDVSQFFTLSGVKLPHLKLTIPQYDLGEGQYGINRARVVLKNWSKNKVAAVISTQGQEHTAYIQPFNSRVVHLDWEQPFDKPVISRELVISEGGKVLRRLTLNKKLPEIIPDEKRTVFFIENNKAIQLPIDLNLAKLSQRDARLLWEIKDLKGSKMVSGVTTPNDGQALLRIFWSFMTPGNYKLHLTLVCKGEAVAKVQRDFRLVNSPFQGI